MINWWIIRQLSEMKQNEILREAENLRLRRRCSTNRREPKGRFYALLNSLGKLLVSWGLSLQERSGAALR